MASKLQITGGEVIVDDDLLPILACCNWHIMEGGSSGKYRYARRRSPKGYYLGHRTIWIMMHRLIADAVAMPNVVVDHINGDTLDNRRANLRITTAEKNLQEFSRRKYLEEHPQSKVSDHDVTRILLLRAQGHIYKDIAEEVGVSKQLIRNICNGIRGRGTQVTPPERRLPSSDD